MWKAVQWVRSLIFIVQMYVMLAIVGFGGIPLVWINRRWVYGIIRFYCNYVRWSASWMVGLKSEIRGEVPQDGVLVAAKHQSFFDILLIAAAVPRLRFIMKKELKWAPVIGTYAKFTDTIPVDRGKRGQAIKDMIRAVKKGAGTPSQLVIYPQGTRVAAGVKKPYKVGAGVLYAATKQDVVPVATNVGVFWKRHGIMRYPGVAVVEFLPRIPAGKSADEITKELEDVIETASDTLMEEAGFTLPKQ
ncbi:lysophospholipid acyltransferase family protein [Cochlodiniinecator piscidefendens]|uniref:lysophospholipid acyltransferase family protein n=1 Tax=Cochlodiniinecator piscidefendens TaxID=2715756 RepID=UPI001408C1BE|nr:lysophospholipid acyltransferase family protein [Cochlodiniinecator piscidefendens]